MLFFTLCLDPFVITHLIKFISLLKFLNLKQQKGSYTIVIKVWKGCNLLNVEFQGIRVSWNKVLNLTET